MHLRSIQRNIHSTLKASLFIVLISFTSTSFAEYYVAYSAPCATCGYVLTSHHRHHYRCGHRYKHHRYNYGYSYLGSGQEVEYEWVGDP